MTTHMTMPTLAQWVSFGRHIVTYVSGAVTGAVAAHLLTGEQGNALMQAIGDIAAGVTTIAGASATVIAVLSALWAAHKQSSDQQIRSVEANPGVARVVVHPVSPELVEAIADPARPKVVVADLPKA